MQGGRLFFHAIEPPWAQELPTLKLSLYIQFLGRHT
jgi:hypothetical protein